MSRHRARLELVCILASSLHQRFVLGLKVNVSQTRIQRRERKNEYVHLGRVTSASFQLQQTVLYSTEHILKVHWDK